MTDRLAERTLAFIHWNSHAASQKAITGDQSGITLRTVSTRRGGLATHYSYMCEREFARSCWRHCENQDFCLLRHISLVVTSVCNFWPCWLSLGAEISFFREQKPWPVISCRGRNWGGGLEDKVLNRHTIKKSKYFINITKMMHRHSKSRPTDNR